jgi:hypothetical protein
MSIAQQEVLASKLSDTRFHSFLKTEEPDAHQVKKRDRQAAKGKAKRETNLFSNIERLDRLTNRKESSYQSSWKALPNHPRLPKILSISAVGWNPNSVERLSMSQGCCEAQF